MLPPCAAGAAGGRRRGPLPRARAGHGGAFAAGAPNAPPLLPLVALLLLACHKRALAAPCRMEAGAEHDWCGLPWELSNFQGHFPCSPSVILGRPRSHAQLASLLRAFPRAKAAGVGHSWWQEQFCAGADGTAINVLTTEFDDVLGAVRSGDLSAVITIDERELTVTCPAGVTQRGLLEHLAAFRSEAAPQGYTLGSFSWFIDQTIGGAVATGSHGSSFLHGSLSSQLRGLKWMDAEGKLHAATPEADPHLWRALGVSVGRLGVILEVTFKIVPNENVRRNKEDISVDEFARDLRALQEAYVAAKGAGGAGGAAGPGAAGAVWEVLRPWNDAQVFWHVPLRSCWLVTFTRFNNGTALPPPVDALDGPSDDVTASDARQGPLGAGGKLPPGAYPQRPSPSVGTAPGIERGPVYWAGVYATWLQVNVIPEMLPARRAFLSLTEVENRLESPYNSYELAVPLARAADCFDALRAEVYGARALWQGFRVPGLLRFVAGEQFYLSPTNGGPALYFNLEDHVSYATGRPNAPFQAVISFLRTHPACRARMHWGKAGWPQHARCFDGAAEHGVDWCHFGCAARALDPGSKFAGESDVWSWHAADRKTGARVSDFGVCCGARGFDTARCACAPRPACG